MKKLTFLLLFFCPLLILANNSFFELHQSTFGQLFQMQNDRAYRINEHVLQSWSYVNLVWENSQKNVYYYDPDNRVDPDSILFYIWNSGTSSYQPMGKYILTFEPNHDLVTHLALLYGQGQDAFVMQEITFSYNAQGYLTHYQIFMSDNNGVFGPFARMEIQYVSSSNYQVWEWEAQNDDAVQQWSHRTFLWDPQGRITQETSQYSLDSLNWVNEEQVTHTYHPNDTTTGNSFVYNLAHQLPYSMITGMDGPTFGMQTEALTQRWTSQWVNKQKQNWTYTDNHLTNETDLKWQGGNWVNEEKYDYTYDSNFNVTELIKCIWDNPSWINDQRNTFNWESVVENSDNIVVPKLFNLSTYPNPFSNNLSLRIDSKSTSPVKISLYNLKGELLSTTIGKSNADLNLNNSALSSGIYFLKATQGNISITKKVLKIK